MAQSLEQYIAEATNAYRPAQTAIQTQIDALGGNLSTATDTINRNYKQQQEQLDTQRNQAARAASIQAAASGGGFSGAANIANRKYYEQSFVPAQTQLQTNQANDLAKAQQEYQNQLASLNAQKANLEAQANQAALQQYWAAVEAEKQQAAARAQAAASQNSAYERLMNALANSGSGQTQSQQQAVDFKTWLNKYSGANNSTKQFYNNLLNVGLNINSQGVTSAALKKISNTPIYQQYLSATGRK